MAAVKKSISIQDDILVYAQDQAKKYFSGNLSSFIAHTVQIYRENKKPERDIINPEVVTKGADRAKLIDDSLGVFK